MYSHQRGNLVVKGENSVKVQSHGKWKPKANTIKLLLESFSGKWLSLTNQWYKNGRYSTQ